MTEPTKAQLRDLQRRAWRDLVARHLGTASEPDILLCLAMLEEATAESRGELQTHAAERAALLELESDARGNWALDDALAKLDAIRKPPHQAEPDDEAPPCDAVYNEESRCQLSAGHHGQHYVDKGVVSVSWGDPNPPQQADQKPAAPLSQEEREALCPSLLGHASIERGYGCLSCGFKPAPAGWVPNCAHCGEPITDIPSAYNLSLPQAAGLWFCMKHHARLWQVANVRGEPVLPSLEPAPQPPATTGGDRPVMMGELVAALRHGERTGGTICQVIYATIECLEKAR